MPTSTPPPPDTPTELEEAWNNLTQSTNPKTVDLARTLIAQKYFPMVENIAKKISYKKPGGLDLDDLISAGYLGLLQAIDRFDPTREILFSTFAKQRVRGAILDEINSLDWTPRLIRERIKAVLTAEEIYYHQNPDPSQRPSPKELKKIVNTTSNKQLTLQQITDTITHIEKTFVRSIDHTIALQHEEQGALPHPNTEPPRTIFEQVQETINHENLEKLLNLYCTSLEKTIIHKIFYEEKSMRKISQELNMPLPKISENKKTALQKLSQHLSPTKTSDI